MGPFHERAYFSLETLPQGANKTLFSFVFVSGQEKRKQVETVHLFRKYLTEVSSGRVRGNSPICDLRVRYHDSPLSFRSSAYECDRRYQDIRRQRERLARPCLITTNTLRPCSANAARPMRHGRTTARYRYSARVLWDWPD